MTSQSQLYPTGQHPYWCDLNDQDCGRLEDPTHIGRTSHMFAQTAEARVSLQLWRSDSTAPAGNHVGTLGVLITMTDPFGQQPAIEVLFSIDELRTLALLCSQYVEMAQTERKHPIHVTAAQVLAEGPA